MHREWYKRGLFVTFIIYTIFIILITPFLLNDFKPENKNICGYVNSYLFKGYKENYFYLKSQKSNYIVISSNEFPIKTYLCMEGDIEEIEESNILYGNFSWKNYLRYKNVFYKIKVKSFNEIKEPNFIFLSGYKLRNSLKDILMEKFTGDELGVLIGIFFGEKQELTGKFKEAVIKSGVMHLLVASGSNVAYIATMFFVLFHLLSIPFKYAKILSTVFVLIYSAMVGFDPPITRAFFMYLIVIVIMTFIKKNIDAFQILIIVAFIMLIFEPLLIYDISFLMSFVSVYGIITGYSFYSKYINAQKIFKSLNIKPSAFVVIIIDKIIQILLITFFAQLALFPLFIKIFYKFSIISLLSNLFLIPLSFLLMIFVMLYLIFFNFNSFFQIFFVILKFFTAIFIKLCYFFASFKFSTIYFSFPNDISFIFSFAVIFIILNLPVINIKLPVSKTFIFLSILIFLLSFSYRKRVEGIFEFENYGVNGAIIAENGKIYLLNPVINPQKIITSIYSLGYNNIDFICISSKHAYRKKTVKDILNMFDVKKLFLPLWICNDKAECVFNGDKAEIFDIKFNERYGYFNYESKLKYCYKDKCFY